MYKLIFSFVLLLTATAGLAQNKTATKYAAVINQASLKKHLGILASDSLEGRETGTKGQRMAAEYIENHFKKIGLKPLASLKGYQQYFPLRKDSLQSLMLMVNGHQAIAGVDVICPIAKNETNNFELEKSGTNNIVFAGYGIDDPQYSDYENIDVKGKIVVIFSGEPQRNGKYFIKADNTASPWERNELMKANAASARGAIGMFVILTNVSKFTDWDIRRNHKSRFHFVGLDEENEKHDISYCFISHDFARNFLDADMDMLLDMAKKQRLMNEVVKNANMPISYAMKKHSDIVNASNILGVIEGTDKKDEFVFLTAHYDHLGIQGGKVYNGADDDGSGTTAVMMMAEAFAKAKKEGHGPRRTVVCMTVSGEEKGLWGSEYYSDHPVYPLEKTSVDLNTDMIGRMDTERKTDDTANYVYVVGHDKISSELPLINEKINNENTKLVLDYKFDDPKDPERIYYRSDHYNFARKGVPVLFFYDGMLKADYHKPTDDIEKISWSLFEKRAHMIFLTAWEMANRNEMLIRDKPLP